MVDDRDIREILIHNINVRFRLANVESLLAYQILLFLILRISRKHLIRDNDAFLKFESAMDLSRQFADWAYRDNVPSKTSMKSAMEVLNRTGILMFEQQIFDDNQIELIGLIKKRHLWCCIDLKEIRDSFAPFSYNMVRHEYFESHLLSQIDRLNIQVASYLEQKPKENTKDKQKLIVSANSYQLGLRLIFEVQLSDFNSKEIINYDDGTTSKISRKGFLFESYEHFSKNFSYYFKHLELANSSISGNLDKLHEIGFIHVSWEEPSDFIENVNAIIKTNKPQLYIELFLDVPED
ncbi:MAG: hypothetical protein QNK36_21555 [Colwellia sp.]|nr:hypothetical protein [Colwellia sp.]